MRGRRISIRILRREVLEELGGVQLVPVVQDRVVDDVAVGVAAKYHPYRRVVSLPPLQFVVHPHVHVHLADVLVGQRPGLQVYEHEAPEVEVIEDQVDDKYMKAILSTCGCSSVIIKRLNDNRYDWVGSIFCEFTRPMDISETDARKVMHEAATNIQYILPEFK